MMTHVSLYLTVETGYVFVMVGHLFISPYSEVWHGRVGSEIFCARGRRVILSCLLVETAAEAEYPTHVRHLAEKL